MWKLLSKVGRLIEDLPLRPAIAAALLLGLALPVAIAASLDLAERREALLARLGADHRRLTEVLAIAVATPIWEVRPDTARPLVEAAMRDERVVEVRVSAPLMPDFVEAAAPQRASGEVISVEQPVVRAGEVIGTVHLAMTTGPVDAEVADQGRQVLATGLAQLALGLLLLFPLLGFKVLVPVRRLVADSRVLAAGALDRERRWTRRDELGVLGRSFEDTRRSLRRLIGDLEASNEQLRRREAELGAQTRLLRATLDNMTDGISVVDAELRLLAWNDRFVELLEFPEDVVATGLPITELHSYDVARQKYAPPVARDFVDRMRRGFAPGQPWSGQIERADGRVIFIRRRPLADGGFVTTYTDVTDQVTAERSATEALRLLEAVMDAVPAILHVKDRELRYRLVNRYFLDLWGFRREHVIGRTLDEVFDPKLRGSFVDRGPEVLASGRSLPFYEFAPMLPGGERIELLGTKVPLLDEHGAVTHVVTFEVDITQRKQAERALRESEELHRLLVDLSPFGILLHDHARIRFLNPAGCRILGVPEQEPVLGMHYIDFVADDEKAVAFERVSRLFEAGEPLQQTERRLITIDGMPVDVAITAVPVRRGGETLALVVFQDIGPRKAAERALKESERFYRELIEVSPYGVLLHDANGIVFINPAGRAILGVTSDAQIEGRHYGDFVHPADRAAALERLQRVRDGQSVPPAERRLVTIDGREIEVAIAGVPLVRGGERLAFVVFGDVTERRRAEQERQRWLQLFQDAMASIPNGFAVFDPARRLVTCNAAFAELYEASPDALAGSPAAELLQRFSRLASTVAGQPIAELAHDLPGTLERLWWNDEAPVQVQLTDGRWLLVAHHRTAEGGLVIVRTDITDLKRMQEALSASEELYRLLVDLAPYGILLHDHRAIVLVNPAGCRMLGTSDPAALVGRHYCEFVVEAEREAARARLARVLAGEVLDEAERRLATLDGKEITVVTSAVPFGRPGAQLAYVFFVDVSERKRAESEIARQREALHQAEKMSALGSLLAGVAHELNNPLSVVVGRAIMLEEHPLDPAIAASVAKIRAAAERCSRIVRTFLAMARQQAPERTAVPIAPLIDAALELLGYGLQSAGITVERDLPADLPPVLADADQLTQVFNNLIVNARQAMADSPPPRLLRIAARADADGQVRIRFADTGPGIGADIRARIFDPFFTTKPAGVGTGIGLAVCRGIVEAHGGSISLEAPERRGSRAPGATFTVVLPAAPPARGDEVETTPAEDVPPPPDSPARPLRALVVDDEAEIASMLSEVLSDAGYRVSVAANGRDALTRLRQEPFDLLISDLVMPEVGGQELYRALKKQFPELLPRLIFITGDTLGPAARRFLGRARRPVIEKPFAPADVLRVVQALRQAAGPDGPPPAERDGGRGRRRKQAHGGQAQAAPRVR